MTCARMYSRECPISLYNLFQVSESSENELDEDDTEDYENEELNNYSDEKKDSNNSSPDFHSQDPLVNDLILAEQRSHGLLNENKS